MYDFAVIDSAFHEGLHHRLQAQGAVFASLFDETPEHALVEIAPFLVALDNCPSTTRAMLLKLGQQSPCLTYLQSEHDLAQTAAHLRQLHTVRLVDGGHLLLRWYDTRVQSSLFNLLTPPQLLTMQAGLTQWYLCDRFGHWQARPHLQMPKEEDDSLCLPLEFSATQFSELLDQSQPDVLLLHLQKTLPDETRLTEPHALFALLQTHIKHALALGLDGLDAQTQYLMPLLYTSGKAANQPAFLQIAEDLKTQSLHPHDIAARVQALDDATWNCGAPLWVTAPHSRPLSASVQPAAFPHETRQAR